MPKKTNTPTAIEVLERLLAKFRDPEWVETALKRDTKAEFELLLLIRNIIGAEIIAIKGTTTRKEPQSVVDPIMCEECDKLTHRYTDPNTGREGWSCDDCGWSWDD